MHGALAREGLGEPAGDASGADDADAAAAVSEVVADRAARDRRAGLLEVGTADVDAAAATEIARAVGVAVLDDEAVDADFASELGPWSGVYTRTTW